MNQTTSSPLDLRHWGDRVPKVSCLCPTFGRTHLLGEAIESFLRQDYPGEKELIVLNDHPGMPIELAPLPEVRVVNLSERCTSLGEKRNALAELATGEVFFPWDDDDISLPWRVSLTLSQMTNHHYFKPSDFWWWTGATAEYRRGVIAHAMAGYSRELFEKIGGYPPINSGEDQGFEGAVCGTGFHHAEELGPERTFYLYRLNKTNTFHISDYSFGGGWDECAAYVARQIPEGSKIVLPGWRSGYDSVVRQIVFGDSPEATEATYEQARILIGICSCHRNEEKRAAVRETWLASLPESVDARFFVGEGTSPVMGDTVALEAPDDYDSLPAKVIAFFRHALANFKFDYLFKCDDDTYVVPQRLPMLLAGRMDLIGNPFVEEQGFASGGAGYFLSRKLVEAAVNLESAPTAGAEDVLITGALIRNGVQAIGDRRLRSTCSTFPRRNNDLVTAHWCSPDVMRAIHAIFQSSNCRTVFVNHPHWQDALELYDTGHFVRASTSCAGRWALLPSHGIELQWFDWGKEFIRPESEDLARSSDIAQRYVLDDASSA